MYRYARTRNRVHRVHVEGGRAFKIEQCNLDDVAFLRLEDVEMEGQHCAYCWTGWVEPSKEEKAKADEAAAVAKDAIPANAKPVPLVQSTRRMAIVALAGTALLAGAVGVAASPDPIDTIDLDASSIADLRSRVDDLLVQVRVLSIDINGHSHEQPATAPPVVIVLPSAAPIEPTAVPTATASAGTTPEVGPFGIRRNDTTTTIIVVPDPTVAPNTPQPTPVPTPAPTPVPTPQPTVPTCFHPGVANGADRCRWPHQP